MSGMNKRSRMVSYVGATIKCTIQDGRMLKGTFLAYDRCLNMVIADVEEVRTVRTKKTKKGGGVSEKEETRTLGLLLLRGESVLSITVEGGLPKTGSAPAPEMPKFPPGMPPGMIPPPGMMPPGAMGRPPPGMPPGMMPGMPPPGMYPPPGMPPGMMPGMPPPGMHGPPGMPPRGPMPPGMIPGGMPPGAMQHAPAPHPPQQ
eukprot:TRINITY_DN3773_c3_g1_i1.p1 TRINITY_DN3773_c3_g1~~TRINITY_DN3773_c3_g1_i1.p1  ORF type:complete len:202 (+),score=20.88 TRINITY_DN3773_c3_g1_i1:131-736(+)